MTTQVFQIAPAASKAMWGLVILPAAIMLLVTGVLAAAAMGARSPGSKCHLKAFVCAAMRTAGSFPRPLFEPIKRDDLISTPHRS